MGDSRIPQAGSTKLLVLDADGVFTDGALTYGPAGEILQRFDVHDGYGIRCLQSAGILVAILTGRVSPAVAQRAETLGITDVVQGSNDKAGALRDLAVKHDVALEDVCYVGDDVFDMPPMRLAGWSAAPANARREVKAIATHVCEARGGGGAVREVVEIILTARGAWPPAGTTPSATRS